MSAKSRLPIFKQAPRKDRSLLPWGLRFAVIVVPLIAGTWLLLILWKPSLVPPELAWPVKLVIGLSVGVVIAALGLWFSRANR
jgi:uncharacterized membrane protein YhhN